MENLPAYISVVFIFITFLTVGILFYVVRQIFSESKSAKIFVFLVVAQMIFQAFAASAGFYQKTDAIPPRLFLFGLFPALLTIILFFAFARRQLVEKLPIIALTWIHVIRIFVEIVLYWLAANKLVPELMTFTGRNFDILAGLSAPLAALWAFRGGRANRPLLIIWNLLALGLLVNIVVIAIFSLPFPFQQTAFEQPNIAVLYFPFVWLPTVIVPIVLFAHLANLWNLCQPENMKSSSE